MTEVEIFEYLRKYQWAKIWNELSKRQKFSPIETVTLAFLNAAWWQENDLANMLLTNLPYQQVRNRPSLIFLKTLTQMSLGEGKEVNATISYLKKLRAPSWQINWLTLEYLGRTAQYKEQAVFLNVMLKKQTNHEDYPFIACLQSLENPNADVSYLKNIIARHSSQESMLKVLAVRVGFYIGNEAEAVLKSIKSSDFAYPPALYRLGFVLTRLGKVTEAVKTWDELAKIGQIDKPVISSWLSLSLSHIDTWHETPERVSFTKSIVPTNLRNSGQLASYLLIYHWINGHYAEAYSLVKKHHEFLQIENSLGDRMHRIFFRYVLLLASSWQNNKAHYQCQDEVQQLYVIGESHSLSVSNMVFDWLGNQVKATTRFVMGVKMFHLANISPNQYQSCIEAFLHSIPTNSHLLVTVGEIDCRPDEGIWKVHQKNRKNIEEVISETVSGYLSWLEKQLTGKPFLSITIQGIPAPGYPLDNKNDPGDKDAFLKMICEVNRLIKDLTKVRGWNFLDVWSATANLDGIGNSLWHLDGWHLKPTFYSEANKWLCV